MRFLRGVIFVFVMSTISAVVAGGTARQQAEAEWKKWESQSTPLIALSGAQSKIERSEFLRITNSKDWVAYWCRHVGKSEKEHDEYYNKPGVPEVDFDSCLVVATTLGKTSNTAGIRARYHETPDGTIQMRLAPKSYQTGPKADAVQPYGFFVIPRSKQRLVVELDTNHLMGAPPKWEKVASFANLK